MSRCFRLMPVLAVFTCAACRQDMQQQPKYTPLARSHFFPDGRTARPIPAGTVAIDELNDDPGLNTGAVNGAFLTSIPVPLTKALLERGEDRFNIYCSPCHARVGDGNGMITRRGLKRPADLNGPRVRNAPPGYLFAVITKGYGAMPDYSYQLKDVRDRWAIVAYIRALELSRQASLNDVPPAERMKLEGTP